MPIGEFALIEAFTRALRAPPAPFGPGDDCAVLPGGLCVTTDACVEGVHFTRPFFSLEDVGHKALAVNLSDLAAMGAKPQWFLCALGLPPGFSANQMKQLARGMSALARRSGAQLIGGNITASKVLTLTITAGGVARKPLLRSTTRAGDLLYVSGTLGLAAEGLKKNAGGAAVRAQKRPEPQLALGLIASRLAHAAIDISDGLLQDVGHVCDASKVGAQIDSDRIPIRSIDASQNRSPRAQSRGALELALRGGEDYELALAVPATKRKAFEKACARARIRVTAIGRFTSKRALLVDGRRPSGALGFDHLA